ncbi:uncharacterized protein LOC115795612 [Archocentrus centrarchus]|uniref:uncharacterized protein LOC115795612 n=1 Tax=Archocentrus centrarchus TaxID=63155 RepID=UPI0011EA1265|nr:uncharacterized protein LOC115795612 [Archocentrus centrarchus]
MGTNKEGKSDRSCYYFISAFWSHRSKRSKNVFFVILALLFCFDVQGTNPVFGELNEFEGSGLDLDFKNNEQLKSRIYNGSLSPVNLTVDSVSNSSDSCKLSVTCSTKYFDINSTFTCDTKTCYKEEGEQRETAEWSSVSLHVYLSDGFIICNHSNQVNWTNDMTEIRHFCPQDAGSNSPSDGFSICRIKTVVFSVGLIIMVSAVIGVHVIEKLKN